MAYYDPLDARCKSRSGAIEQNEEVLFAVFEENTEECAFVLRKDGEDAFRYYGMTKVNSEFRLKLAIPETGLYFYHFKLSDGAFIGRDGGNCGVISASPEPFQLTVYKTGYSSPEWFRGGIMYQIFPDRFNRSGEVSVGRGRRIRDDWFGMPDFLPDADGEVRNNDFFGGNLKGIEEKIGYLKSLNVTALYLNPIFEAYSNHRYDTGDYMRIDGVLGTETDLKNLIETAAKNGIKIFLDGVFNHTGADSVYFNKYGTYNELGAFQSKDSPYYNWYKFIDYPNLYESWWGIKTLPELNENNEDYARFITGTDGVLEKYTKMGIGGWRLDVADELPSEFVRKIRAAVKGVNSEAVVIGEVWEDASNKISYGERRRYFQGEELDSVMNYTVKEGIIEFMTTLNPSKLALTVREQVDRYPKCALDSLMNVLSTHDTFRIISALSLAPVTGKSKAEQSLFSLGEEEKKHAAQKVMFASLLQYSLPGVPCIFYGDEAGLEGFTDPLNRKCFPWGREYAPLLDWYKTLGDIRSRINLFSEGNYKELFCDDRCLVFERTNGKQSVVIGVNMGKGEYFLDFDGVLFNLLTDEKHENRITLKPCSCGMFYVKPKKRCEKIS